MTALVRTGMEAGDLGLSSGLYYAPGSYAKIEEVIALAKVAGEFGGVYSSQVIFDPATIRDAATYAAPQQLAEGVRDVMVNGVLTIDNGTPTGATPGRVLRPERR